MNKKRFQITALTLLFLMITTLLGSFITTEAADGTLEIIASEDSYIRDGSSKSTNFGNEEFLRVKNQDAGYNRRSYVKFNISELDRASTEQVILKLEAVKKADHSSSGMTDKVTSIKMYRVDTNWTEETINWNNAPYGYNGAEITSNVEPICEITREMVENNQYQIELDLTYLITDEISKNTEEIAFVFDEDHHVNDNMFSFYSKEASGRQKPTLSVSTNTYEYINPIRTVVEIGEHPTLPNTVEAVTRDGATVSLPVEWEPIDSSKYETAGTFTVEGVVTGTSLKAIVTVIVTKSSVESSIEIQASGNAFTRDGSYANTNYSTGADRDKLVGKNSDSTSYSRKIYLEFDLSDVSDQMNYIELNLELQKKLGESFTSFDLYLCDSFVENTLTWNTAPARLINEPVASFTTADMSSTQPGGIVKVNLTNAVKKAKEMGKNKLSLELWGTRAVSNDEFSVYSTRTEAAVVKPMLIAQKRAFDEVPPYEITVEVGTDLQLPNEIPVLNQGEEIYLETVWDSYDPMLLNQIGRFEVTGILTEYGYPVKAIINVIMPENYTGTTYYVDAVAGSDNNRGTSENTAIKSLTKVNALNLLPGDQVLFKAGGIWNGQLAPKGNGVEGHPIKIDQYGTGNKPIINGNGQHSTQISGAVMLNNQEYWEISNLEITNYAAGESYSTHLTNNLDHVRAGILIFSSDQGNIKNHIVVSDCYVHDVVSASSGNVARSKISGGIIAFADFRDLDNNTVSSGANKAGFHGILFENNRVERVMKEGVRTKVESSNYSYPKNNTDVIIRNNYISHVYGDGIVLAEVKSGGLVEKNLVLSVCEKKEYANFAGVWTHFCDDAVVQYNEVSGIKYGYNDGEAFDIDNNCYRNIFQYNYSHDNYGGSCLFMGSQYDTEFRYNISYNDGWGIDPAKQHIFFYAIGKQTDVTKSVIPKIYNNTFYYDDTFRNNGDTNFTIPMFGSNDEMVVNFQNNIVATEPGSVKITYKTGSVNNFNSNSIIRNNLFSSDSVMTSHGLTKEWLLQNGNLYGDPQLLNPEAGAEVNVGETRDIFEDFRARVANFKPTSNSPAIGAGVPINTNALAEDILGNPISARPTIGAVE